MAKQFKIEVRIADMTDPSYWANRYTFSEFLTFLDPLNEFDCTLVDSKVDGQFFYKKTIKEKIIVGGAQYELFKAETQFECRLYYVNVSVFCEGSYKFIQRFYFNKNHFSFDFDTCQCEIELQIQSLYDEIDLNKTIKGWFLLPGLTFDNFLPTQYKIVDLLEIMHQILATMNLRGFENDSFGIPKYALSDFFNWQIDPTSPFGDGKSIGFVSDTQRVGGPYLTAIPNYVNPGEDPWFIGIGIKSNIIDPGASTPAEAHRFSFVEFEKMCREVFNVYWILETEQRFTGLGYYNIIRYIRWEHFSWFQRGVNYDATSVTNFPLNKGKNKYKNISREDISSEVWTFADSGSPAMIGSPVEYPPCINSSKIGDRGDQNISIDFDQVAAGFVESNDGFVLFDLQFTVMPPPRTILLRNDDPGGGSIYNGRMSNRYRLPSLFKHNRPYSTGKMNNVDTVFLSPVYNKEQSDIIVKNCCDEEFDKSRSLVKTKLGNGQIQEASTNYRDGQITFKLNQA